MDNRPSIPSIVLNPWANEDANCGPRSLVMLSGIPCNLKTLSTYSHAAPSADRVVLVGMKCPILVR